MAKTIVKASSGQVIIASSDGKDGSSSRISRSANCSCSRWRHIKAYGARSGNWDNGCN